LELLQHCTVEKLQVTVKPWKRQVVLTIRDTLFKSIVQVPPFVKIQCIKAKLCIEKKLVVVEAPHCYESFNSLQNINQPSTFNQLLRIPVTFMTERDIERDLERERERDILKREWQPCEFTSDKMLVKEEQQREMLMKRKCFTDNRWCKDIEVERELQQQLMRTLALQHIRCKVDTVLRLVIVKVVSRDVPFKRIIRVPEHVNIHLIKVKLTQEKNLIRIVAPFMTTPTTTTTTTTSSMMLPMLDRRDQLFDRRDRDQLFEQSELSQFTTLDEYEPIMYKIVKHLRRQCPLVIPRIVRCHKTKQLLLHMDFNCSEFRAKEVRVNEVRVNEVRVKDVLVTVNKCQNVLLIKRCHMPNDLFFELAMPKHFDVSTFRTLPLNERTLRIVLPFQTVPYWNMPY